MNVVAIVQARMGSTRLPRKVLKKIKGKPILGYVIERLQQCASLDEIVVATTTNIVDTVIERYCLDEGISCFRGSEDDVLSRYYEAAKQYGADIVVRVTSDCPLIAPEIVDEVIARHKAGNAEYTANIITRSYPRGWDVEVMNFEILQQTHEDATKLYHREHVTLYIREHPEKFKLINVEAKGKLRRPDIRITLDTPEDFQLIAAILTHFRSNVISAEEIIDFLNDHPQLLEINKEVQQKSPQE